jgi:hypothetical protein
LAGQLLNWLAAWEPASARSRDYPKSPRCNPRLSRPAWGRGPHPPATSARPRAKALLSSASSASSSRHSHAWQLVRAGVLPFGAQPLQDSGPSNASGSTAPRDRGSITRAHRPGGRERGTAMSRRNTCCASAPGGSGSPRSLTRPTSRPSRRNASALRAPRDFHSSKTTRPRAAVPTGASRSRLVPEGCLNQPSELKEGRFYKIKSTPNARSPTAPSNRSPVAQLDRTPACVAGQRLVAYGWWMVGFMGGAVLLSSCMLSSTVTQRTPIFFCSSRTP